ncbi:MAG: VWA domain-containing protein [Proteobacteria bacterium]|nr:VWA domain-containing protein [Pseudomonadota bacterium]
MIRFAEPWLLIALVIVPLMMLYEWKRAGSSRIRFSSLELFKGLKHSRSLFWRKVLPVMRCLVMCLFIMALARPQSGTRTTEIITEGVDIMLCLDTSGSMNALDFTLNNKRVNRLQVVKKVVNEFIHGRQNDRMGMVVFAEEAFTQCPLTLDYGVLLSFLDSLEIGMAGDSTAIGSAIATCVKRLKDLKSKSKTIILLTDGRNNTGTISPATAADIAKTCNIKVYTIGVGTEGEAPFLVDSLFGKRYVYQKVDLDEETLQEIAQKTGGTYFRATNTEALKTIYQQIDKMEKTEARVKEYMEYEELFAYFLIPGLCLLLAEIVLGNTKLRKIP